MPLIKDGKPKYPAASGLQTNKRNKVHYHGTENDMVIVGQVLTSCVTPPMET